MKAIMYHYVRPFDQELPHFKNLHIEDFSRQLDYFQSEGGFLTRDQFLHCLKGGKPNEGFVLTFDDGFKDHYQFVVPELLKRGLWGIFYITTGVYQNLDLLDVHKIHMILGKAPAKAVYEQLSGMIREDMLPDMNRAAFREETYSLQQNDDYTNLVKRILNYYIDYAYRSTIIDRIYLSVFGQASTEHFSDFYLSIQELKHLADSGMILGSHTVNHPVMSKLPLSGQQLEIEQSFNFLSDIVSTDHPKTFCYPYGGYHTFTKETVDILNKQGVQFSFNVEPREIKRNDLIKKQSLPRFDCKQVPHGNCRT